MNKMVFKKPCQKAIVFFLLFCLSFMGVKSGISIERSFATVSLDHRIELLYIIDATSNIGSYHNCQLMNTVYHQEVIRYFRSFSDHEAVIYYRQNIEQTYDFKSLEEVFLGLPPNMQAEDLKWKDQRSEELAYFVKLACAFYADTSFRFFMNRQHSIITQIEGFFQRTIHRQLWLEDYMTWFSSSVDSMHIILAPLKRSSHYIHHAGLLQDEGKSISLVFGLTAISNGFLVFVSEADFRELVLCQASRLFLREGLSLEKQLLEEAQLLLEHHILEMDLPYHSVEEYIASQLALSMYWIVMQKLDHSFPLDRNIQEKTTEGYVLISDIHELAREFVFQTIEQPMDWTAYAPLFLAGLIRIIPDRMEQKNHLFEKGASR